MHCIALYNVLYKFTSLYIVMPFHCHCHSHNVIWSSENKCHSLFHHHIISFRCVFIIFPSSFHSIQWMNVFDFDVIVDVVGLNFSKKMAHFLLSKAFSMIHSFLWIHTSSSPSSIYLFIHLLSHSVSSKVIVKILYTFFISSLLFDFYFKL